MLPLENDAKPPLSKWKPANHILKPRGLSMTGRLSLKGIAQPYNVIPNILVPGDRLHSQ
jgi:hypothetical protein